MVQERKEVVLSGNYDTQESSIYSEEASEADQEIERDKETAKEEVEKEHIMTDHEVEEAHRRLFREGHVFNTSGNKAKFCSVSKVFSIPYSFHLCTSSLQP